MSSHHLFHVLVALQLSSAAGRKKLNGIHRFLNEGHDWDIELIRSDHDLESQWPVLSKTRFDGILVSSPDDGVIRRVSANFAVPAAYVAYPQPKILAKRPFSIFVIDNEKAIAQAAAGHFCVHCRLQSIAYVPTRTRERWSDLRQRALVDEVARRGRSVSVYGGNREDRKAFARWVAALPKPAGILAAFDDRARDVLEACRLAAIRVPEEVSVLGIGNDEPICEMTLPKLTSVAVDFEMQGYRAARELQAMMLGKRKPIQRSIRCGVQDVVIRASTSTSRSDALAARTMDFVERHFLEGISPADVIRHLNVSRSLVYLRFGESFGTTLLEAILARRLGKVTELLETTDRPISEIARLCGYHDANYLKNLFRKRMGMSMREWRAQR